LDNGSIQKLETLLLGSGKIEGVGALTNTLNLGYSNAPGQVLSVQLSGNLSLIHTGSTLTLTNSLNDYSGETRLNSGSDLILGADHALSANSVLVFESLGGLQTYGRSATVAGLAYTAGVSTGIVGASTSGDAFSSLEVRVADGQEYNYGGAISGNIVITKTGAGKQTLSSSFQAGTRLEVQEGTLEVHGEFSSGAETVVVRGGGTLLVNSLTYSAQPQVHAEAGGTVTRSNVFLMTPGEKLSLSMEGDRETVSDLLYIEGSASYTASFRGFEAGATVSDILSLSGLDGQKFVLQLSFDPDLVGGDLSLLRLGWWEGSEWQDAWLANSVEQSNYLGERSWESDATYTLGDWGIDTDLNAVWMVLDHNSEFAVIAVPEPSTVFLTTLGLTALLAFRRKK
jgi:hypothetical protein